ncbi:hyaluronan/mRNA-binding protein [Tanacetum coccineum]
MACDDGDKLQNKQKDHLGRQDNVSLLSQMKQAEKWGTTGLSLEANEALWVDIISLWQPVARTVMIRWTVHGIPRFSWESGCFDAEMGLRWVPLGAEMGYECVWGLKWVGLGDETGLKSLVMACILSKMELKQKHRELRMRIVVLKSVSPEQLMTFANAIDAAKEMSLKEYDKVLQEKRKGLVSLKKGEQKVAFDNDLEKLQLLSSTKSEKEIFFKLVYILYRAYTKIEDMISVWLSDFFYKHKDKSNMLPTRKKRQRR